MAVDVKVRNPCYEELVAKNSLREGRIFPFALRFASSIWHFALQQLFWFLLNSRRKIGAEQFCLSLRLEYLKSIRNGISVVTGEAVGLFV